MASWTPSAAVRASCMAADAPLIRVEVAYALPDRQFLVPLDVPEGTSAYEALLRSGLAEQVGGVDFAAAPVGIFGRKLEDPRLTVLADGDRVEVYRPLRVDPMESRRRRARAPKT